MIHEFGTILCHTVIVDKLRMTKEREWGALIGWMIRSMVTAGRTPEEARTMIEEAKVIAARRRELDRMRSKIHNRAQKAAYLQGKAS